MPEIHNYLLFSTADRYNQLNIALGVHLQVYNYKKKTAPKALKTHQNELWNWLIRIIKYFMALVKFYENFMIFIR